MLVIGVSEPACSGGGRREPLPNHCQSPKGGPLGFSFSERRRKAASDLRVPAKESCCPVAIPRSERVYDFEVFADKIPDPGAIVIGVVFTQPAKPALLSDALKNERISRHRRQHLVELGVDIENISPLQISRPGEFQDLFMDTMAALERGLVQLESWLQQAGRLDQDPVTIARIIGILGIQHGKKDPTVSVASPHETIMRQARQSPHEVGPWKPGSDA